MRLSSRGDSAATPVAGGSMHKDKGEKHAVQFVACRTYKIEDG